MHTLGKHEGRAAAHTKKNDGKTVPDEKKQPKHGKAYPQSRTFFSRNGKKSLKKSVPPPEKIPDFSDLFPWNGQFYVIQRTKIFQESPFFANRRTKISQERPVLCQPKDKNFPRIAIFCQQENKNFPETTIFMPAKGEEFREKGHFCASRRTKISRERPFFANRRTRISRKRPVLHQPEDEKNESNDHFPSPGWEIPTKISPPKGRKSEKNFRKNWKRNYMSTNRTGIFPCSRANDVTEISHRRDIFAQDGPHFLCSLAGKRTFYPAETYGSRLENLRFTHRKHRKHKEKERLSCRHFQNTKHRKNKRTVYRKKTEKPHTEKQGKQSEGKLTENQEDKSGLKTEDLT